MPPASGDPVGLHASETGKNHLPLVRLGPPRSLPAWRHNALLSVWLPHALDAAGKAEPHAAGAAEWLLDNAFLVQRARLQIDKDLPEGFYRKLRTIGEGPFAAEPLVLVLAHDLIEAAHFQLSSEAILTYLDSYQEHVALNIAELWALPAMLRIACLERLVAGFGELFADVAPPYQPSASCGRLHPSREPAHCVSRAIANLAVISNLSWNDIFDAASLTERGLAGDPAGLYPRMDFETRDAYRRKVEVLAERSGNTEGAIVAAAIAAAAAAHELPHNHVGYWLIGPGQDKLGKTVGLVAAAPGLRRMIGRHPGTAYLLALLACGLLGLVLPALWLMRHGAMPWQWGLGLALTALPATVLSVTLVNWLVTLTIPPSRLARFDFADGIDPDWPTLVAMPVIIGAPDEVPALLARLEAHRIGNPEACAFVLLSDPVDAATERTARDAEVEAVLCAGIDRLNRKYAGSAGGASFCLLHRWRQFNPAQGCWIAWERKRGKLEQFNAWLLGGNEAAFAITRGPLDLARAARLVVTADADTRLPPGSVARLAATLAHPLNRPVFDPAGRVSAGYTVLQPRIEIAPHGSASRFARLFGGDTAIDIYSRAVSDVFQDLVGTGNFVGKGIYDVAAFTRSLAGRIPENQLLSHDLWEGLHGRAGLVSDIIVYESFPANYREYVRRWHRWVRGDWQLLPWLLPTVPGAQGTRIANRLSLFDRLRIWDTMRRSLVPPSVLALLLAGWFMLPGGPVFWTLLALLVPGAWLFTDLVTGVARGRRRGVLESTIHRAGDNVGRWVLQLAFLLSDSAVAIHAVGITLLRLRRRRRLLDWTSAAHVSRTGNESAGRWPGGREVWASPLLACAILPALVFKPGAAACAAPLLLLWLGAPWLAEWTGRSRRRALAGLAPADRRFLRRIARRNWFYFESFAGPEDHWLPPDNHQREPLAATAHRTSPTNIGMLAISALSAWRLGHLDTAEFAERIEALLTTLDRLEKWHGHLLNWYDTRTLAPLEPRYASSVDSGNLAASCVVLAQGCHEVAGSPLFPPERWDGLEDGLALLAGAVSRAGMHRAVMSGLDAWLAEFRAAAPLPHLWPALLDRGELERDRLRTLLLAQLEHGGSNASPPLDEAAAWIERLSHALQRWRGDMQTYLPWTEQLADLRERDAALAERIAALLRPSSSLHDHRTMVRAVAAALRGGLAAQLDEADRQQLRRSIGQGLARWRRLDRALRQLSLRADALAQAMDFKPLYDPTRNLFHIGYDVSAQRLDQHYYDLLASEARLSSYFAIAKQDAPVEHWFHLGRPIVKRHGTLALVSWNGSMFEYLMPSIFLRSDPATLLGESELGAVACQRAYGRANDVPWGISESGFAALGPDRAWRYRAFGVPELGLRRGLGEDMVVAPYASALALSADPLAATANLRRLAKLGALTRFGFCEALDFSTERRLPDGGFARVDAFMAHHQGMTIAAIANTLHDNLFVRWFHADPRMATVDLILNERVPWELPAELERLERFTPAAPTSGDVRPQHWEPSRVGAVQLLGNGRLSLQFRADGSSALSWKDQAITPPLASTDNGGPRLYLRDRDSGLAWSPSHLPMTIEGRRQVTFHAHKVELQHDLHDLAAALSIVVSPTEDVEIRRLRLVNTAPVPRSFEFASLADVALASPGEWRRHPAFARLFMAASQHPELNALLFERRARDPGDPTPVLVQRLVHGPDGVRVTNLATARSDVHRRLADAREFPHFSSGMSNPSRHPRDAAAAFLARIELAPHADCEIAIVSALAASRGEALELARRYGSLASLDWAEQDAATYALRHLRELAFPPARLAEAEALYTALFGISGPRLPGSGECGRSDLWALGLSGDLPILLCELPEDRDPAELSFVLAAHRLWRWRGSQVDLVLLHPGLPGYVEPLRERIVDQIRVSGGEGLLGTRGGLHIIGAETLSPARLEALRLGAGATLAMDRPDHRHGFVPEPEVRAMSPRFTPIAPELPPEPEPRQPAPPLRFANGPGGFTDQGNYRIACGPGEATPAPWANVIANPDFGTIVTEAGLGMTYAINSGENRLTPWHNDPLADPQGEAVYLRDEETGEVWTVTPLPAGREGHCETVHQPGSTSWSRRDHGLDQRLSCSVAATDPVKLLRLDLRDRLGRPRRITVTCFIDWILGAMVGEPAPFRVSRYDPLLGAIIGHNGWNGDFAARTNFLAASLPVHSLTTSRLDFLGDPADWHLPAGLANWDLGERSENRGEDAIAAMQVHVEIGAGTASEVVFVLGQAESGPAEAALVEKWRQPDRAKAELAATERLWDERLGAVSVQTPDPAFDLMVNRWLPYQARTSRLFARAGFYQASGAYGFRDQLQDVLALTLAEPELAREQILRAAAHQFEDGDVLHWWHPPAQRGVRTRCSDDMLWLPHAVSGYVRATGDTEILDQGVSFLHASELQDAEADRYAEFPAAHPGSLFEHCLRAFDRAWRLGAHDLPLIGSGDWNDGMNRIGSGGRGESVWLAWFMAATITDFAAMCRQAGRSGFSGRWSARSRQLLAAIEQHAWDGEWYMRAFDDQGRPWGSHENEECRIDLLSQAWAVIAGGGDPARARTAMDSAFAKLVRPDDMIVRLLDPPFASGPRDPGYIAAYPPGVRENGGQYSHAAAWLGIASAIQGDGARAKQVFDRINPIRHSSDQAAMLAYSTEPYVVAADIGGWGDRQGRGGWTWYTGAAAWTWRLACEYILGLRQQRGRLVLTPCLPPDWPGYSAHIRKDGEIAITVRRGERAEFMVDGKPGQPRPVAFPGPGKRRTVELVLAEANHTLVSGA